MRLRPVTFALCLSALATSVVACKKEPTIPGTEIPDTSENRDILAVLERYRTAFVRRDAAGVLATAHPTYYDTAGTDDPGDDVEYTELGPLLRERMAQLESVRFTIDYLEIDVLKDRASVRVWIDASFRLQPVVDEAGAVKVDGYHTRKQDHALFELVRDGRAWRITRGL
ncbi:MAG: hypothetical protein IPH07_07695 [Deltaproteobacteria bacterium]|mgnify:CR=1 FL=1|jgi:hypothetical protein|nr:hypothetical protein [Deltaproteobacteria bacterium]MBK8236620.1 hypothetical protein [Deltaproteobacteria bacterium]MBP7288803.1 hypothetical protein [Nannocystaceae bacterium]